MPESFRRPKTVTRAGLSHTNLLQQTHRPYNIDIRVNIATKDVMCKPVMYNNV